MNIADLVVVGIAALAGLSGWRSGMLRSAFSAVGFVVGAALGLILASHFLADISGFTWFLAAAALVVVAAGIGQGVAGIAGNWLKGKLSWKPIRVVDSLSGAVFAISVVALLTWLLSGTFDLLPWQTVSRQVDQSVVISRLDTLLSKPGSQFMSGMRSRLEGMGLPPSLAALPWGVSASVDAPDPALLKNRAVRRAWGSLVKVEGIAAACDAQVDGSGFVYAPDRVMTNAHVVAGVAHPEVIVRGTGKVWTSSIVYFDPNRDIAVLYVPGLNAPPLEFAPVAKHGDAAVVAGFPGGGRLAASAARIRARVTTRGSDIYGKPGAAREIYSIRGTVRPGNSGGPLLSPDGHVDGVVFATAVNDPQTGYVLTAREVAAAAAKGAKATQELPTGSCATKNGFDELHAG
jgi:S1-C subfamily serine protease